MKAAYQAEKYQDDGKTFHRISSVAERPKITRPGHEQMRSAEAPNAFLARVAWIFIVRLSFGGAPVRTRGSISRGTSCAGSLLDVHGASNSNRLPILPRESRSEKNCIEFDQYRVLGRQAKLALRGEVVHRLDAGVHDAVGFLGMASLDHPIRTIQLASNVKWLARRAS